jgi:hypothetical protein
MSEFCLPYNTAHHDLDLPSITVKLSSVKAVSDDSDPLTCDFSSIFLYAVVLSHIGTTTDAFSLPLEITMTLQEALKIYEIYI